MTIKTQALTVSAYLFIATAIISCGNNDKKDKAITTKDSIKPAEKKVDKQEADSKPNRPPIINIVDSLQPKMVVIYCKDSAANFDRIGPKLGNIYGGKLAEYIKRNNLKMTGAPMAWYTKQSTGSGGKPPYFFEAGIPVSKAGAKAVAGVQVREMAAGKAVIAHFFGPFDLLPQGYDALTEFIKDNKKTVAGPAYEVYLTDPFDKNGKPVDPYKIQTDIVFPVK